MKSKLYNLRNSLSIEKYGGEYKKACKERKKVINDFIRISLSMQRDNNEKTNCNKH